MNTLEKFKSEKPDIEQLRKKYPELSDLLKGEFADVANDYSVHGLPIVSWELKQGKPKNPTYGMIDLCNDVLLTSSEYTERVRILGGVLEIELNILSPKRIRGEEPPFRKVVERGKAVSILPEGTLRLTVKGTPVYYFCQYI